MVILNYNGREHLEACLPSLDELEFPRNLLEILVVDNGSTDGSPELVRRLAPHANLVVSEVNRGFSSGINLGARKARGDLLAFLNNDTRVHPKWLHSLCHTLNNAGDDVVAVAGKILNWDGTRLDFGRGILTFDGHAFQKDSGLECDKDPYQEVAETLIPCGGNMLIRKSVFLEMGGFDEEYFAYLEDVDLAWRLWSAGYRVLFDPEGIVYHRSAGTSSKMDPFDRGFLFERNAFFTAVKNLDDEYFPRVFPAALLTLLNRTYHLIAGATDQNNLLSRYPFTEEGYRRDRERGKSRSLVARLQGLLPWSGTRDSGILTVSHPHSISQLRAVHYILDNLDRLLEKREAVQARRIVPDREIFARFPPYLVPTYPGDQGLFASRFFRWLLGIDVTEASLEDLHHSES